jgi:ankyrin repeat protein
LFFFFSLSKEAVTWKSATERDASGFLPLHFAALKGQIGLMRRLIQLAVENKQNVKDWVNDSKNERLQSPLHWCCSKNQLAAAILLVEVRLLQAILFCFLVIVLFFFLKAGSDPNLPDVDGYSPLLTAAQVENWMMRIFFFKKICFLSFAARFDSDSSFLGAARRKHARH